MTSALLIIDVQNDFTSRAADGSAVATQISQYVRAARGQYDYVIGSCDWHDPGHDNGGHFPPDPAASPPGVPHCVAGTPGADYDPQLDAALIDVHVRKGQGFPGFSIFEGTTTDGVPFPELIGQLGITRIDVTGIATEGCVAAAAQDGARLGLTTRVLADLCRGFCADRVARRLAELTAAGVQLALAVP